MPADYIIVYQMENMNVPCTSDNLATVLKTLFSIVELRFKNGWTLMSVLYNDFQMGQ